MPSAAPASIAVSDRGRRIVSTTIAAPSRSVDVPSSASTTLPSGTCVEPSASDSRKATTRPAASPHSTSASRVAVRRVSLDT